MNQKAITLKNKVQHIIDNSEYRSQKVSGVSCSRSDLEMIVFFCDIYLRQGNFDGYVCYGNVKEVLQKAGFTF